GGDGGAVGEAGEIAGGGGVQLGILGVAVQNGGKLLTGDAVVGTEAAVTVAAHDAVGGGPGHPVGEPLTGGHVSEGSAGGNVLTAEAEEDGDQHTPGEGHGGGEGGAAGAGHETLAADKGHALRRPVVGGHVGEAGLGLLALAAQVLGGEGLV